MSWVAVAVGGSALIGANSAKKAGEAQAAGTDQALGYQQNQSNLTRQDTQQYRDVGGSALNKLADLLGVPRAAPTAPDWTDPRFNIQRDRTQGRDNTADAAAWKAAQDKYQQELKDYQDNQVARQNGQGAQSVLQSDPGHQFRLDNTNKTIDRYQSAGRLTGGRAIKEAMRYGQDFASNEFGNATNRLFSLAGFGPQGVNTAASAGMNAANNMSNISMQAGENQAASYANQSNAIQNGVGNFTTYKTYNDWMSRLPSRNG